MPEIQTDGNEYHLLDIACDLVKDVPGLIVELGNYLGGGMLRMMNHFHNNGSQRIFVGIDPYGAIPYANVNGVNHCYAYSNRTKSAFLSQIYKVCHERNTNFIFFNITDNQFFNRFPDGIPVYEEQEVIHSAYALVVIDGPHEYNAVFNEFNFFKSRMNTNGIIVFDDICDYDHKTLHEIILAEGFDVVNYSTYKAVYKKL